MPNERSSHLARPWRLALAPLAMLALGASPGCSDKGKITFLIESPSVRELSPFQDVRRDFVSAFDEATRLPLGRPVTRFEEPDVPQDIGDIPVGMYDVRLHVLGGGQLLGVARTPRVEVVPLAPRTVTLSVRKPLLFYMSQRAFAPGAVGAGVILPLPFPPLRAVEPTLPTDLPSIHLPDCKKAENCPGVSASTADGKLLLIAVPGRLLVLASGALYDADSNERIVAAATILKGANEAANPHPREIALNADTSAVAVVTDQGVSLVRLSDVVIGATQQLGTIQFPDAMGKPLSISSAAWAPDGATLTVLAGPAWDTVACNAMKPTATYEVTLDGVVSQPVPAPAAATDIVYGPDRVLLFATPCGAGVVRRSGDEPTIGGAGVSQILVAGGRIFGIPSGLSSGPRNNPDNPVVSLAHVQSYIPGPDPTKALDSKTIDFEVPSELIAFKRFGQPVLIRLQPKELTAYDFAATPDAGRIAIASRVRYEARNYTFYEFLNPVTNKRSAWCTLNVVRDIYRVSEVDAAVPGAPLHERVVGSDESTKCVFECSSACDINGKCTVTNDFCSLIDGFVPTGLSLAFGSY